MSLPPISQRVFTTAPAPTKPVSQIHVRREEPRYILQTIRRLEVFDDVVTLETPAQIQAALDRWRHCLHAPQVARLQDWLDAGKVQVSI
jgi:hypothetical protein